MTHPRIVDPFADLQQDPFGDLKEEDEKKKPKYPHSGYSALADLGRGLASGVKHGLRNTADAAMLGVGGMSAIPWYAIRKATEAIEPQAESNSGFEAAGKFVGRMAGEAPLFMGVQGAIGGTAMGAEALGAALPTATSRGGAFLRGAKAALPENVVSGLVGGVASDPGSAQSPSGLATNVALSSLATAFSGLRAMQDFKTKIAAAPTVEKLRAVQQEIKQLYPSSNPQDAHVTQGELPSAFQAAERKARASIDADIERRHAELLSGKFNRVETVPETPEYTPDSIERAYAEGMEKSMRERIQVSTPIGGKKAMSDIGIIGSLQGRRWDLTWQEVKGYYDMLASFKPYKAARLSKMDNRLGRSAEIGLLRLKHPELEFFVDRDLAVMARKKGSPDGTPYSDYEFVSPFSNTPRGRLNTGTADLDAVAAKGFENLNEAELRKATEGIFTFVSHIRDKGFTPEGGPTRSMLNVEGTGYAGGSDIPNPILRDQPLPRVVPVTIKVESSYGPRKTNFDNPATLGNLSEPGSGVQSSRPYVPPSIPSDPLAQGLTTKFTNEPLAGLNADEAAVAKHIDFDNAATQEARLNNAYLVNTFWKKLKYRVTNMFQPIREVSEEAFDNAAKFQRINRRVTEAINTRLRIPTPDGEYVDGPESIKPMFAALGGDAEKVRKLGIYMHARQVVAGEGATTAISPEAARNVVTDYATSNPDIVNVYETRWKPLTEGALSMYEGYHNLTGSTPSTIAAMRKFHEAWAPLSRAAYGDAGMSFTRARGEHESTKLITDPMAAMYSNIRSLIYNGERAKIVAGLAQKAIDNPEQFSEHIKIIPYEKPPGLQAAIDALPKDIPEIVRQALAEATLVYPKGANKINIRLDNGSPVTVYMSKELQHSLNDMEYFRSRPRLPENADWKDKLTSPAYLSSKVKQGAGTGYAIWRDVLAGGPIFDAIEARMNNDYGFNPITDPFKGFKALTTHDEKISRLYAAGAGKGMHGANPEAEVDTKSLNEIRELSARTGLQIHLAHPVRYAQKLLGDLGNAVSAGASLRALENGASYSEAATVYNTVMGDPYISGAMTAALNRHVNWFNYPLKANERILDNFTSSPSAGKLAAKGALTFARAVSQLSIPAAAIWYLTKDDEELTKARQDPIGQNHLLMRNPFDEKDILAFRMPYLYGALFMKPVITTLDKMYQEGQVDAVKQVGKAALAELVPNVMPLAVNAILPLYTGQKIDPFQGTMPVVPESRRNLLPQDQDDGTASPAARKIAEWTGASSGAVENVFRTFLIGSSYTAYRLANDYAFDGNTSPATFNSFTFIPGLKHTEVSKVGIQNVTDFYREVGHSQQILGSLKKAEQIQPVHYHELIVQYRPEISNAEMLASYKRDMDAVSQQINEAKLNESWDPERKKYEIDKNVAIRIMIATKAMEKLRARR